ncbi:helix-turn-helix transcriptional regulator [Schinkia azotoformans]|uniref:helix-turn-helix domain-containing protein n=1 Tax=Schinkia azotoformans TaxID=1454 RepID=UPI002DBEF61D|nr:helix-turn-helix transcriptional regulator [Schinkia azotoformans]MEC1725883.1 helix-turn-helix transcriptional regulator [Schinkia azotoformans]
MSNKDFGLFVKLLRTKNGLKLKDIAVQLNRTIGTISHIETGRVIPKFDVAYELLKILGIPETEIKNELIKYGIEFPEGDLSSDQTIFNKENEQKLDEYQQKKLDYKKRMASINKEVDSLIEHDITFAEQCILRFENSIENIHELRSMKDKDVNKRLNTDIEELKDKVQQMFNLLEELEEFKKDTKGSKPLQE